MLLLLFSCGHNFIFQLPDADFLILVVGCWGVVRDVPCENLLLIIQQNQSTFFNNSITNSTVVVDGAKTIVYISEGALRMSSLLISTAEPRPYSIN